MRWREEEERPSHLPLPPLPSPAVGNPLIISSLFPRPPFFCTTPLPPFVEIVTLREVALVERGRKRGKRKKLLRPSTLLFFFFSFRLRWVGLHRRGDFGFWGRGGTTAQRQTGRQTGCGVEGRRTGGGLRKKRFPPSLGRKEKWKGPSSREARLEMEKKKKPNLTDMMD